ncbi:MAG: hypothetical protein AB7E37_02930 [Candidatus Altimarinota bacterium]
MSNSPNPYPENSIDFELIIKNCLQDNSLYIKLSEEDKQEFWNIYFNKIVWYDERGTQLPINIANLRNKYHFEDNFNRFIPGIMKSLEEEGFTGNIDDIFVLDNEARIFFDSRLIENLGDLYYNTLADFLEELSKITGNDKLKIASDKIRIAWGISEAYVDRNNPPKKHENAEFEIELFGGVNTIAERIGKMNEAELGIFLLALSQKIWKDGEKDSNRPSIGKDGVVNETKKRTKLATALFEASLLIK